MAGRGRAKKGQKWSKEKQCWYYPAGVTPQTPQEKPKEMTPVKTEGLTTGEVAELLAKQREEFMAELNLLKQPRQPEIRDFERSKSIDVASIPEHDLLAEPRHYYAWSRYIYVDNYNDRGMEMSTPYNKPIELKAMTPQVEIDGQGKRRELHWCSTKIWSKKEAEFLENHPYYKAGIIKSSVGDLKYDDARSTSLKMQVITNVSRLNRNEILSQCRGRHIAVDNDFQRMRNALIESMCQESIDKFKIGQKASLEESAKNAALLM